METSLSRMAARCTDDVRTSTHACTSGVCRSLAAPFHLSLGLIWRVLFFSLIAWPVLADEPLPLLAPSPIPQAQVEGAKTPESESEIPALPLMLAGEPLESPILPVPEMPTGSPGYWIVSSRQAVQTIHEASRGSWGLNVFHRCPTGEMSPSNLPALTASLNPQLPVCIFVHGSFVKWESQCHESHAFYQRLCALYGGPLQMIFFTWPSDGPRTHLVSVDVAVRGRRADFNGFHLGYLLTQIPESCPVTLIGHSHGGRLILSTMHLAGGGTIEGNRFPYSMGANRRFRAVLAAGALDHNWLNPGQPYSCALNRLECLLNLQNKEDRALFFYPLSRPFAHRAIARAGVTPRDYEKLGYNGAKIRDVDVTSAVGAHHYWPNYYQQPSVVMTILPYLVF